MPKKVYIGSGNVARNIKKMYVGVDSTARNIKKGYVGVDGVARQFWPGVGKTKFLAHFDGSYVNEVDGLLPTVSGTTTSFTTGKFGQGIQMSESLSSPPKITYEMAPISIAESEDFCVECWFKLNNVGSTTERPLCNLIRTSDRVRAIGIGLVANAAPYSLRIKNSEGSVATFSLGTLISPVSWTHIAIYRQAAVTYAGANGKVFTDASVVPSMFDLSAVWPYFNNPASLSGGRTLYFDEARVTVGDSRYGASDFTPPTAPFVVD